MFNIEMLPAKNGDSLIVEYGDEGSPKRILIDGGTPATYPALAERLKELQDDGEPIAFELLIITHIDDDHIGGILTLLEGEEIDIKFRDIWFNGYGHLGDEDIESMGPVQGERLTKLLLDRELPWNRSVGARSFRVRDEEELPEFELDGGMKLTLLSPDSAKLAKLRVKWEVVCAEAGLIPNDDTGIANDDPDIEALGPINMDELLEAEFHEDTAEANGSSIAFLAEFDGKRVLFGADAHPTRLMRSIDKIVGSGETLELDACKLSHHGSDHNTSPDLLRRLNCSRFLVSTSGAKFKHPHKAAMARVIRLGASGKEIIFNYRSQYNEIWDDETLQESENYSVIFPESDRGVVVEL